MIVTKGNLLETNCKIIAHQVNCKGVMGAGLARQIKQLEPIVFTEYQKYIKENGAIKVYGTAQPVHTFSHIYFNLFAQYDYGRDKQYTSYEHLKSALNNMCDLFLEKTKIPFHLFQIPVAIPYKMGCGLAGGDWEVVEEILKEVERKRGILFITYKYN